MIDSALSLSETNGLVAAGLDPADFVALTVEVMLDIDKARGVREPSSGQDVVVVPAMLVLPRELFVASRVLDKTGRAPNPVAGVAPVVSSRMVVRRDTLSEEAQRLLSGERGGMAVG